MSAPVDLPEAPTAYVISLARVPERRNACRARLEGRIPYVIVDAVDGCTMSEVELRAVTRNMRSRRLGRLLTPGEVACSLSHVRALKNFIATGGAWGLILEDDFSIHPWGLEALPELLTLAADRSDVDLIKLGGSGPWSARGRLVAKTDRLSLLESLTFGVCAHAYLVSSSGARRLVESTIPIEEPFDTFLRDGFRFGCALFETSPWLFGLDPKLSTESALAPGREHASKVGRPHWRKPIHSLRRNLWNYRRFGWRAVFAKSSFRRFPTGEA